MNKVLPKKSELRDSLLKFKPIVFKLFGISAVINLLLIMPSIYMLQVYDRAVPSQNITTLVMLSLILLGMYVIMQLLELARTKVMIRVGNCIADDLGKRVFHAAFSRNLVISGQNAGQALHDLTTVRQFLTGNGLFTFFDAPWAPIYLAICFMFHWILGLFVLCGILLLVLMTYITEKTTSKPLADANYASITAANYATNSLRNAEVIEAMGMLPVLTERWAQLQAKVLQRQTEASDNAADIGGITKFIRLSMQSLILGLGAWLAIDHQISSGMMIAGSILMGRALQPVELAIGTWKQLVSVRVAYARLNELLNVYPEPADTMPLPRPLGIISAENVFAAPPGVQSPVLRGMNFTVPAGDIVGIVGPSGSGKSTLARLLVGVWKTQSGKVRLDSADVFEWDKSLLGQYIGYLPQDIELFNGTISENIARFGNIDADAVIRAAQKADVHEMILRFPQGYETEIGGDSGQLSGGQRQRIALARALYKDPSLIVLDEPNSNLDDVGERALIQAVSTLKSEGRTVFIITHRTSILNAVDKLMVLREGAIQLFGERDQVLAALTQSVQAMPAVPNK